MTRRALLAVAAAFGLLLGPAQPAHAACGQVAYCTRIVHSVYSATSTVSVATRWPPAYGPLGLLARGSSGSWVGWYNPQGYKVRVTMYDGGRVVSDMWWFPTGWYKGNSSVDSIVVTLAYQPQND